jgi:hypothetical protein
MFLAFFMEGFLMTGAGLGSLGIRIKIPTISWIAVLYGLETYIVRDIYRANNIPFGTHTFFILGIYLLLLIFIAKRNVFESLIATLIGWGLIAFGEVGFLFPVSSFMHWNLHSLMDIPGGMILASVMGHIPMLIMFFIVYVRKMTIIDFSRFEEIEKM